MISFSLKLFFFFSSAYLVFDLHFFPSSKQIVRVEILSVMCRDKISELCGRLDFHFAHITLNSMNTIRKI